MLAGGNAVSKVLDCLRMHLVAVVIHEGVEASSSKSVVNYSGHKIHSDTVYPIWDVTVPIHCNLQRMLQTPPEEQVLHIYATLYWATLTHELSKSCFQHKFNTLKLTKNMAVFFCVYAASHFGARVRISDAISDEGLKTCPSDRPLAPWSPKR